MANPNQSAGHRSPRVGLALRLLLLTLTPLVIAFFLAAVLGDFDPAPFPAGLDSQEIAAVEKDHRAVLGNASERVGDGLLPGPEDLAYDEKEGFVYTGCNDGWIRRFRPAAKEVEDWAYVGGRPLGLALSPDGTIVVAEAYKGLLKVNKDGKVNLLTDEAEGLKFKLTDGVDVSSNGLIYFTDASHKYNIEDYVLDFLEGRPNGRLISFDPSNNQTIVLARDLYFANGVAVSPDHLSLIFCETPLRRCRRYFIKGEKKGAIDKFVENLPGYPDNIKYDGEGQYWIGLSEDLEVDMNTYTPIFIGEKQVSHLLFADDLLLFGKVNACTIHALKKNLETLRAFSGLEVNILKSNLCCVNDSNEATWASNILNIPIGKLPLVYLGISITFGVPKAVDYDLMFDKIQRWLNGWKSKLLSYGGRFQLLRFSINGHLNYWFRS